MALSLALGECVCECDVSVCTIAVRVCVVKTSVLTYQLVESGEFQQKCLVSTRKAKRLTLNSSSNGFFFFFIKTEQIYVQFKLSTKLPL